MKIRIYKRDGQWMTDLPVLGKYYHFKMSSFEEAILKLRVMSWSWR